MSLGAKLLVVMCLVIAFSRAGAGRGANTSNTTKALKAEANGTSDINTSKTKHAKVPAEVPYMAAVSDTTKLIQTPQNKAANGINTTVSGAVVQEEGMQKQWPTGILEDDNDNLLGDTSLINRMSIMTAKVPQSSLDIASSTANSTLISATPAHATSIDRANGTNVLAEAANSSGIGSDAANASDIQQVLQANGGSGEPLKMTSTLTAKNSNNTSTASHTSVTNKTIAVSKLEGAGSDHVASDAAQVSGASMEEQQRYAKKQLSTTRAADKASRRLLLLLGVLVLVLACICVCQGYKVHMIGVNSKFQKMVDARTPKRFGREGDESPRYQFALP